MTKVKAFGWCNAYEPAAPYKVQFSRLEQSLPVTSTKTGRDHSHIEWQTFETTSFKTREQAEQYAANTHRSLVEWSNL